MCHCKNDDCSLKSSECSTGTLIISVMVLNLFSGLLLSRSVNTGSFNVVTVYAVTIGMHVLNVAAGILAIVKLKRRGFIAVMAICVIMIAYHICIVYLVMAIVHNVEFLYFIYFLIRSTPSSKVIDDILIAPSAAFTMFIILQLCA
ncbi:hypothetical protein L596_022191 [Steinernema carpocapsae]|uniref:Uncharacterized protein n=1 Tax=Steinernema carpocapsae TaxID=34508 RepID=A0A4U5ML37_STECR|nr:hypothetical protein L596_022191 [Steinernema carpocapsae]